MMGFYPAPNPRVISISSGKTFEQYLVENEHIELLDVFALYIQQTAFSWVIDYAREHDNFLPTKDTLMFANTSELVECLRQCPKFNTVPDRMWVSLLTVLPASGWYCHPTYPISLYQLPA